MKSTVENTLKKTHDALSHFLHKQSAGGVLLLLATAMAIYCANSNLVEKYDHFIHMPLGLKLGEYELVESFAHWVNDGLMAIFFFLIGLEVKREFVRGELSSPRRAVLPIFAAIGGMVVPAAIYVFLNWGNSATIDGWAIPAATDIAFALGILALLGDRVPVGLKILLAAIAVIDDLGAVVIIALFYTHDLMIEAIWASLGFITLLYLLYRGKVASVSLYVILGLFLWLAVLKSGVHATLAGIITALLIPLNVKDKNGKEIAEKLEHRLHPWVTFGIMPLFAFVNAGISLSGLDRETIFSTATLGIFFGLCVGKQLGIFSAMWLAVKMHLTDVPRDVNWQHLYGLSILCGIGFTMSLFIGNLAFYSDDLETSVRLGVIGGSLVSALLGAAVLLLQKPSSNVDTLEEQEDMTTEI